MWVEMFEEWCWQDVRQARKTPQCRIRKFKKKVGKRMLYFYQKIDDKDNVLFESTGYLTRDGRNKAVRRAMGQENIKLIEE